jgi:hypothetical protein
MPQVIEEPGDYDISQLAEQLQAAQELIRKVTGRELSDSRDDLALLQAVVDAAVLRADQTYEWQCLGLALGRVFVAAVPGLDWAVVEDEYGRDPALRFEQTSILLFPLTMISKRVEAGEGVSVRVLFERVIDHVSKLRAELQCEARPN